jgi:hypothetical protein
MFGRWKLSVADDVYIKTEAEAILVGVRVTHII